MYFKKAGAMNTREALDTAFEEAKKRCVKHMVIATTRGATAVLAARRIEGTGIKLVVVTHNTGFKENGVQELEQNHRRELEQLGCSILTSTMPTRAFGKAVRDKLGFNPLEIAVESWRMFGEGTKVCIERTAMACDAGLIPCGDVIAIAGSWEGADTVLLLEAAPSNRIFDMKVKEILAKPADWRY